MIRRLAVSIAFSALALSSADAQVLRQLTEFPEHRPYERLAISDDGDVVATVTTGDPAGTNPNGERRVLIWDVPSATATTPGSVTSIRLDSISISDDGRQVAFISTDDPLGTNPDRSPEVFVMDTDGGGVIQASFNPSFFREGVRQARLSGDGSRVVYLGDLDPLGTNPGPDDGLFSYTLATSSTTQLNPPVLTGIETFEVSDDGGRVAFIAGGELWAVNGGGGGLSRRSTNGRAPLFISGDGAWIVYDEQGDLTRVPSSGAATGTPLSDQSVVPFGISDDAVWLYGTIGADRTVRTGVVSSVTEVIDDVSDVFLNAVDDEFRLAVAGGSGRIVRLRETGAPDFDIELATIEADGSGDTTLETPDFFLTGFVFNASVRLVSLTPDGTTYAVGGRVGIAVGPTDGSSAPTILPYGPEFSLSITDDGSTLIFDDDDQPGDAGPGEGCFGSYSIFSAATDGSGLTFIGPERTGCTQQDPTIYWLAPRASRDGSLIAFTDSADVFAMPGSGPPETFVIEVGFDWRDWKLARDGGWVVFGDVRIRTDGTDAQVWAPPAAHGIGVPSDDGRRIAFDTAEDLVGSNPSGIGQIFVWDETTGFAQVTTDGGSLVKHVSGDGSVVVAFAPELSRIEIGGPQPMRLTGPSSRLFGGGVLEVDSSLDGRLVAFAMGGSDAFGRNGDGGTELYVVDLDAPARIRPGAGAPTAVRWDVEPAPLLYDVIRGDVAGLSAGGTTIELGPVACVENDSPDTDTVGSEDPLQPLPGQALFYLYRGIADLDTGAGSYGTSSDGRERVASSGDCALPVP